MKFVKVNYSLNQTYHVEDVAFDDLVKSAIKQLKGFKLIKSEVRVDRDNNDFLVKVAIEKTKQMSYSQAASKIQGAIEDYSMNIIQSKPRNIQIEFCEVK